MTCFMRRWMRFFLRRGFRSGIRTMFSFWTTQSSIYSNQNNTTSISHQWIDSTWMFTGDSIRCFYNHSSRLCRIGSNHSSLFIGNCNRTFHRWWRHIYNSCECLKWTDLMPKKKLDGFFPNTLVIRMSSLEPVCFSRLNMKKKKANSPE